MSTKKIFKKRVAFFIEVFVLLKISEVYHKKLDKTSHTFKEKGNKMKKSKKRLKYGSLLFIPAILLFMGCNESIQSTGDDTDLRNNNESEPNSLLYEKKISEFSSVQLFEDGLIAMRSSMDKEDTEIEEIKSQLNNANSLEAAYKILNRNQPVPQRILDADEKFSEIDESNPIDPTLNEPLVDNSNKAGEESQPVALHKSAWDWSEDAANFNRWVPDPCGNIFDAKTLTNRTHSSISRYGKNHKAYFQAASFTTGAKARTFWYLNGDWVEHGNSPFKLKPREKLTVSWTSGGYRSRKFYIGGNSGERRIHLGVTWYKSDFGCIQQ